MFISSPTVISQRCELLTYFQHNLPTTLYSFILLCLVCFLFTLTDLNLFSFHQINGLRTWRQNIEHLQPSGPEMMATNIFQYHAVWGCATHSFVFTGFHSMLGYCGVLTSDEQLSQSRPGLETESYKTLVLSWSQRLFSSQFHLDISLSFLSVSSRWDHNIFVQNQ